MLFQTTFTQKYTSTICVTAAVNTMCIPLNVSSGICRFLFYRCRLHTFDFNLCGVFIFCINSNASWRIVLTEQHNCRRKCLELIVNHHFLQLMLGILFSRTRAERVFMNNQLKEKFCLCHIDIFYDASSLGLGKYFCECAAHCCDQLQSL